MKKSEPFTVVYEDPYLIAVNKSSGIAVTADRWDPSLERLDRLVAAKLAPAAAGGEGAPAAAEGRVLTVHRIDRDTSGLVIFAKDEQTHRFLSEAFEGRQVQKRYIAVVYGRPGWQETSCDLPLVANGNKKHLTIIDKYRGKKSFTAFRLLGGVGNYAVVEARPETGRTHQIRVHAAALGHPLVCDPLYGSDKPVFLSSFKPERRGDPFQERPLLQRLGLHATELVLPYHRGTAAAQAAAAGEPGAVSPEALPGALSLCAPLPRDMASLIRQMEKQAGAAFWGEAEGGPAL